MDVGHTCLCVRVWAWLGRRLKPPDKEKDLVAVRKHRATTCKASFCLNNNPGYENVTASWRRRAVGDLPCTVPPWTACLLHNPHLWKIVSECKACDSSPFLLGSSGGRYRNVAFSLFNPHVLNTVQAAPLCSIPYLLSWQLRWPETGPKVVRAAYVRQSHKLPKHKRGLHDICWRNSLIFGKWADSLPL